MSLVVEMQLLWQMNIRKNKKIAFLEKLVCDLWQYSQKNNIIISALRTRHRSYAGVLAKPDGQTDERGAEETDAQRELLEQNLVNFLGSKGITVDSDDTEANQTLSCENKKNAT